MSIVESKIQQVQNKMNKVPTVPAARAQSASALSLPTTAVEYQKERTHVIVVTCSDLNISVVAPLAENFSFSIDSDYDAPFYESIAGSGKVAGAASLSGYSGLVQAMTAQVWRGSDGISLTMPFTFISRTNPLTEIRDPILELCKLTSPSSNTPFSLLVPPGPTFNFSNAGEVLKAFGSQVGAEFLDTFGSDQTQAFNQINSSFYQGIKNRITLSVSNFLRFDSIVISSVSLEFQSVLSPAKYNNFPWQVTANVTFKTFTTPTISDLFNVFKKGR